MACLSSFYVWSGKLVRTNHLIEIWQVEFFLTLLNIKVRKNGLEIYNDRKMISGKAFPWWRKYDIWSRIRILTVSFKLSHHDFSFFSFLFFSLSLFFFSSNMTFIILIPKWIFSGPSYLLQIVFSWTFFILVAYSFMKVGFIFCCCFFLLFLSLVLHLDQNKIGNCGNLEI